MPALSLHETIFPGVAGLEQASIKDSAKTVLVAELSAFFPWSWHQPQRLPVGKYGIKDPKNVVSFVGGHASYIKIYWNADLDMTTWSYDPPAGYDYKWSGDCS